MFPWSPLQWRIHMGAHFHSSYVSLHWEKRHKTNAWWASPRPWAQIDLPGQWEEEALSTADVYLKELHAAMSSELLLRRAGSCLLILGWGCFWPYKRWLWNMRGLVLLGLRHYCSSSVDLAPSITILSTVVDIPLAVRTIIYINPQRTACINYSISQRSCP